jgi:hypothetical protein
MSSAATSAARSVNASHTAAAPAATSSALRTRAGATAASTAATAYGAAG